MFTKKIPMHHGTSRIDIYGDKAIQGLSGISKNIDGIPITSETFEGHMEEVQSRLKNCNE